MPLQQVSAVAGIRKNGQEQPKEREYERIFEEAKEEEKKKEQEAAYEKKKGFGRVSCCYGKHALELGFAEVSLFDQTR
jgi:hypothetical protein